MQEVILTLVGTLAVIIIIDTMRKCYQQKEWLLFTVSAVLLILNLVTIML
jgi:hypothetical protein